MDIRVTEHFQGVRKHNKILCVTFTRDNEDPLEYTFGLAPSYDDIPKSELPTFQNLLINGLMMDEQIKNIKTVSVLIKYPKPNSLF